jgi:hypothetical protein
VIRAGITICPSRIVPSGSANSAEPIPSIPISGTAPSEAAAINAATQASFWSWVGNSGRPETPWPSRMCFRSNRPFSVDFLFKGRPARIFQMCAGYTSDTPPRNRGGLMFVPARFNSANISSDEQMKPAKGLPRGGGRLCGVFPAAAKHLSQTRRDSPAVARL